MRRRFEKIIFLLMVVVPLTASAEVVQLKNGKVYEGKIVAWTEDSLKLDTGETVYNVPFKLIEPSQLEALKAVQPAEQPEDVDVEEEPSPQPEPLPVPEESPTGLSLPDLLEKLKDKIAPADYVLGRGAIPEMLKQARDELMQADLNDPETLTSLAKANYYLGEMDPAFEFVQKALKVDPEHDDAWFSLGFLHWQKKDYYKALDHFKKAVALNPELAFGQIGEVYIDMGMMDDGLEYYQEFIEEHPDNHLVYHVMGRMHTYLRRIEDSIEYFKKVIELNPEFVAGHADLAYAYRLTKQYEKAVAQFEKAIALDPEHYYAIWGLGHTYLNLGQPEKALATYKRAAEIQPNAQVFSQIAQGLISLGKVREALSYIEKAEVYGPDDPTVHQVKGEINQYLRRVPEAKASFRKALDLYKSVGDRKGVKRMKKYLKRL